MTIESRDYTLSGENILDKFKDEVEGDDYAKEFLKANFLASVAELLCSARKHTKLTQQQLAERTGRKNKASISRWEHDFSGNISLGVFAQLAPACGFVPRLTLVPFEWAKEEELFKLEHPEATELIVAIKKEHDSDDCLVSEERFYAWADKPTRDDALRELWNIMREGLETLIEDEGRLGWSLRQQLEYYRKLDAAGLL